MSVTDERMKRDIAFMQDPEQWPKWPVLPLRLRDISAGAWPKDICAFTFADGRPVAYIGIIYMLPVPTKGMTWGQVLAGLKSKEYASFEDLAAEYMVD